MRSLGSTVRDWVRQHGADVAVTRAVESVREGHIDLRRINFAGLAAGLFGEDRAVRVLQGFTQGQGSRALEAADAVDMSAFSNITGQLLVTEVQKGYESPEFIAKKLVRVMDEPTPANFDEHKIPLVSNVLEEPGDIQPMMEYPATQLVEDWISLPPLRKRGNVLRIALETIMSDRTGQMADAALKLGKRAGLEEDEEIWKVILGLDNSFKWKGTTYNTYLASGSWANVVSGATVAGGNWQIINAVEQKFAQMTDPYTGKPFEVTPNALVCMPESRYDFKRILKATSVRTGDITTSDGTQGEAPNPLDMDYPVYSSKIARKLLVDSGVTADNVKNYWFLGDFKQAFVYRQLLPLETIQAPPQTPEEFRQDIVMQVKVRRIARAGVWNARYTAKSYGS